MIGIVDGGGGGQCIASGDSGRTDGTSEEVDCISKKARPTEQMTEW